MIYREQVERYKKLEVFDLIRSLQPEVPIPENSDAEMAEAVKIEDPQPLKTEEVAIGQEEKPISE